MTPERAKETELKKVFGVPVFLQVPEEAEEMQKGALYIGPSYLRKTASSIITSENALIIANGQMAMQGLSGKKQLSVYSRIARMGR